jgi:predicted aconitase with swiveling domain
VNFTSAFTKVPNLLPSKKAEVRDRHHPWFKTNIKGKVIALPACIGSTHTGLVLLDLVRMQNGPAAIIVEHADSLLVSGVILSEVWYERSVPIVEYPLQEIQGRCYDGQIVEVDGETGEIVFRDCYGAPGPSGIPPVVDTNDAGPRATSERHSGESS